MNVTDRMMLNKWMSASATKFMHPDKQVRVVFSRPREQDVFEVMLSGPEAESAIRELMQAYADSIGKSLTFCAQPSIAGEQRMPLTTTGDPKKEKDAREMLDRVQALFEGRSHKGIARDWNYTCTDNDCWCYGSEHHNPRDL